MTKGKITIYAKHFYPVVGGLETEIHEVYKRLAKKDWEIVIHTVLNKSHSSVSGLKIKRHSLWKYHFLPFFESIRNEKQIVSLHNIEDFPHLFIYAWTLLLKLLGEKRFILLFSSHGFFNVDTRAYPGVKVKLKNFIDHTLGVFLINRTVDGIRAVSEKEASGLINSGISIKDIKIIHSGLPKDVFGLSGNNNKKIDKIVGKNYFLQIGRVVRIKNLETVIKTMALMKNDTKFVIAGPINDIEYKRELDDLISTLSLGKKVIFLGPVYENTKFSLIRNAKFCIQMSFSEGYPLTILEALSQGTICLVSKGTGMVDMVKDGFNGFVLDPYSIKKLSNKIEYVLNIQNRKKISSMSRNAINKTKGQTWENTAEAISEFFTTISKNTI